MSAAVAVFTAPSVKPDPPTVLVSTSGFGYDGAGCRCRIDHADPYMPMVRRFPTFPEALSFATSHAAEHTCPSWRASGERCTEHCADCGGAGWIHPSQYDADAAFMLAELGLAVA